MWLPSYTAPFLVCCNVLHTLSLLFHTGMIYLALISVKMGHISCSSGFTDGIRMAHITKQDRFVSAPWHLQLSCLHLNLLSVWNRYWSGLLQCVCYHILLIWVVCLTGQPLQGPPVTQIPAHFLSPYMKYHVLYLVQHSTMPTELSSTMNNHLKMWSSAPNSCEIVLISMLTVFTFYHLLSCSSAIILHCT